MDDISRGVDHCKCLLGQFRSKTDSKIPQAVRRAEEALLAATAKRKAP